jgi:UDP:flavonoid glycosyltransferase YjiC (YdhE family)
VSTLVEMHLRGHDVHVATLRSEAAALSAVGLEPLPIAGAIEDRPLDDWDAPTPEEGLANALATFARRAELEIPDLRAAIDALSPDVLLVDIMAIGAAALAETTGLPWAQWIPLFQHFAFDGATATGLTRVPFELHPAGLDVLNGPRRQLGLRPLAGGDDVWPAPLNLYLTAPPFEVPELALPASFRLVGPASWEPYADTPAWFAECAEPIVLVTASSEYQPDRALIETTLAAFADQPGTVVATTAAHNPGSFAAPANARIERWLPHQQLLERASVVVCHGGMGITQKALTTGVPVCVVPFGRDQFEVAGRVAAAGAGTCLPPDQLTPENLRRAVTQAMEMRAGTQRIADRFGAYGSAASAADAIEAVGVSAPATT